MVLRLFARCGLLLCGAGAVGLVTNAVRANGISLFAWEAPQAACELPEVPVATLSPLDAQSLCADPETVVVDVRSQEAFMRGHLPNALHLPCRARRLGDALFAQLSTARSVLVYGQTTDEARVVADSLAQRGLVTRILDGGYPEWESAGLACSSGPCEDCLGKLHEAH